MSCSCRTSTLRVFVRSIAQIHFPETTLGRAAWGTQRPLTRLSRGGLLSELPVTAWSRTFHSTIINHDQSRTEVAPHRPDETEQRQERNVRAPSQTDAAIAELSHEALDGLAAEIKAAKASKDPDSISTTPPGSKRPQRGAIRRLNVSEGSFRKPRDRSMQLKQPWNKKERNTADSDQPYKKEDWQIQKAALKEKFPEGWQPRKKLSPDALAGIRALHEQFPEDYTTEVLADKFEVSPEAIRRILKSKWEPSPEEEEKRQQRWFNRGKQVWSRWAELGKKPPTRWREEGIERKPYRRERRYDEDEMEEEDDLSETGNNRLIARSKLAKNLM